MPSTPDTVLVDTYDKLHACLKDVEYIPTPASVAVDLEGVDLGRHGRISIMQLHAQRSNTVWLIDGYSTYSGGPIRSWRSFKPNVPARAVRQMHHLFSIVSARVYRHISSHHHSPNPTSWTPNLPKNVAAQQGAKISQGTRLAAPN